MKLFKAILITFLFVNGFPLLGCSNATDQTSESKKTLFEESSLLNDRSINSSDSKGIELVTDSSSDSTLKDSESETTKLENSAYDSKNTGAAGIKIGAENGGNQISQEKINSADKVEGPFESNDLEQTRSEESTRIVNPEDQGARILVDKIRLPLESIVQENNYYCVPACMQMVLRYKGIEKTQTELAGEMNTSPTTGTEYADLTRIANKYLFQNENVGPNEPGYHIQRISRYDTNPDLYTQFEQRVRQDIGTNDPIFAAVDVQALYPQHKSANHMVLITGYALFAETDNIAYYYYIDPYYEQDSVYGGLKTVTAEQLMNAIVINEEPAYIW
ncbi:C39 family peptidase [Allobaculum sp. JKK-2023]|uniref:C39 family peptidase n=1 Tax=Allobaculum sp. JKK-2023 TaxID=3108943 RepID=UPI002B055AB3|nr:C39 family peptidase [Allobaculum sp. JKK-2023]